MQEEEIPSYLPYKKQNKPQNHHHQQQKTPNSEGNTNAFIIKQQQHKISNQIFSNPSQV